MENQDHLKTIHTRDINQCVKELPALQVHIRDDVPKIQGDIKTDSNLDHEYVRINQKKNLAEAVQYTSDHLNEVHKIANAAGYDTDDYHEHLERLHKNVPAFVPEGKTANAHDNYIYDVLKRGRPSGETVAHLHDVMFTEDPEIDYKDNTSNQKYLAEKRNVS